MPDNNLDATILRAWLKEVNGTWSTHDHHLFSLGFQRGYAHAREELKQATGTATKEQDAKAHTQRS